MLTNRLKDVQVRSYVKSRIEKKYPDGQGLRLEVRGGSALWTITYTFQRVQHVLSLGRYPDLSLTAARQLAHDLREAKKAGIDPKEELARHKAPTTPPPAPPKVTLRDDMHAHIHHREGEVKASSDKEMIQLLERHAGPLLDREPAKITQADVLAVLLPIWDSKRRSAEKIIAYGGMIWRFSQGDKPGNPFGKSLFGKDKLRPGGDPVVKPRAAMPYAELPQFFAALRGRPEMQARALEFLLLTLTPRSAEVLNATWEQFDVPTGRWHVPADIMKGWKARTIPLSPEALYLLGGMKPLIGSKPTDWVFPADIKCPSGRKSRDTMQILLRAGMGQKYTVHGFRSTLMDFVGEKYPLLLLAAERALDHTVGGKVLQAYLRTGMVDNRAELSELWSKYLLAAT